ncbi:PREDICTED: uncharacterized protein LOC104706074 [Camelina sativa]|uniref:Uncharacterized protein LOC104706074 n=1 Tax=Camelina sativa TaxID=90675 RepID=A0ABM0T3W3_CAMSA|nr:PREDICTED: uncharacterized protein LOC104706074 [Camelina sativa]
MLNFDTKSAHERRKMQLHELEEIRHLAYENSKLYKERTKAYHDKRILTRTFAPNDQVLLFNSRLKLFPDRAVVLLDTNGGEFVVNGQRLKPYLAASEHARGETFALGDPPIA